MLRSPYLFRPLRSAKKGRAIFANILDGGIVDTGAMLNRRHARVRPNAASRELAAIILRAPDYAAWCDFG